jgi:hypothetical protein
MPTLRLRFVLAARAMTSQPGCPLGETLLCQVVNPGYLDTHRPQHVLYL